MITENFFLDSQIDNVLWTKDKLESEHITNLELYYKKKTFISINNQLKIIKIYTKALNEMHKIGMVLGKQKVDLKDILLSIDSKKVSFFF